MASDLHFPKDAEKWIAKASKYVRKRYGDDGFMKVFSENPTLLTKNADHHDVMPLKR